MPRLNQETHGSDLRDSVAGSNHHCVVTIVLSVVTSLLVSLPDEPPSRNAPGPFSDSAAGKASGSHVGEYRPEGSTLLAVVQSLRARAAVAQGQGRPARFVTSWGSAGSAGLVRQVRSGAADGLLMAPLAEPASAQAAADLYDRYSFSSFWFASRSFSTFQDVAARAAHSQRQSQRGGPEEVFGCLEGCTPP